MHMRHSWKYVLVMMLILSQVLAPASLIQAAPPEDAPAQEGNSDTLQSDNGSSGMPVQIFLPMAQSGGTASVKLTHSQETPISLNILAANSGEQSVSAAGVSGQITFQKKYPSNKKYYVSTSVVASDGRSAYLRICQIDTSIGRYDRVVNGQIETEVIRDNCFTPSEVLDRTNNGWGIVTFTPDPSKNYSRANANSYLRYYIPPFEGSRTSSAVPASTTSNLTGSAYYTYIQTKDSSQRYSRSLVGPKQTSITGITNPGWNQVCNMTPGSPLTWINDCRIWGQTAWKNFDPNTPNPGNGSRLWDVFDVSFPDTNHKEIGASGAFVFLRGNQQYLRQTNYNKNGKGAARECPINENGPDWGNCTSWGKFSVSYVHNGYSAYVYPHRSGSTNQEVLRHSVIDADGNYITQKCIYTGWFWNCTGSRQHTRSDLAKEIFGSDNGFKAGEITEFVFRSNKKLH
ncbi:MAG: hypothetical protein AAF702_23255 [Chloroflexota bacterium]